MAFKEYTSCVSPGNYVDLSGNAIGIRNILLLLLGNGFLAWLAAVFLGGPAALLAAIAVFASLVIYLTWWLNGRLICLGGEKCLIGVVTGAGPANPIEKGGDNDFSMNLLLAPGPTNYTEPKTVYWNTPPQGHLVAENAAILGIGRAYVDDADHHRYVASLHCEFEGDGIRNLLIYAGIILALLVAAVFLPPFLSGLAVILAIIAALVGLGDTFDIPGSPGAGDPRDIDPSLGTLGRGDVVIVKGEWVYDSLHRGWNELHPVRDCCIIGRMELPGSSLSDLFNPAFPQTPWSPDLNGIGLDTPDKVKAALLTWCAALDDARGCEEGGSRTDPEQGWVIHPYVDGCRKPAPIP